MVQIIRDKNSPAASLAQAAIFSDLTEAEMEYLAKRAVPRQYANGETIFSEGDSCAGLYVIESGFVKIFKSSAAGREQVLAIDGPGHSIAELPVFDGGPYPASGQAIGEVRLLFVSQQDFQSLCVAYPKVALKVLRVVGRRLRSLVATIEELSFTTVRQRLASMLLRLAREGKRTPQGIQIELRSSNQELAAQIGTVRELVSRNLSQLRAAGIVKLEGRVVTIPDLRALEEEVASAE